jgi:hypothetical protein
MGSGCDRYIEMMSWADGYNVGEGLLLHFLPPTITSVAGKSVGMKKKRSTFL